jgi:predicted TIM-barrel enzyme
MPFLDFLDPEVREAVENTGFRLVTEVDLLGIKITKHFSELDKNFIKTKEKIIAKINFWDRFKLSLAGRISIAKTFLVPVINYLGCIVNPSKKILT